MPSVNLYHAFISQITSTMMVKMEKVGYPKAHQPQDQHRDVVHTTKVMDTVLQHLQPKPLKRNLPSIKVENLFFKVH